MGGGNGQKAKMARERNPEKLRREREELERRQREEKARLQEEAKAAEFARKQAEAEAAAEAKRKLELEREAARLELQQMEKTVEIDENTQLLKDLEMLRSSQPDHIPSSMDETSSVNSQDGLAPFALQGRNCLEQFGLFMRSEDKYFTVVLYNRSPTDLYEYALHEEGYFVISNSALATLSTARTRRSPKHKYVVSDELTANELWWEAGSPNIETDDASVASDFVD